MHSLNYHIVSKHIRLDCLHHYKVLLNLSQINVRFPSQIEYNV